MKKFVISLSGKVPNTLTNDLLMQHVKHLKELNKHGKLYLCGPMKESDKAIKIVFANTIEEANEIALADPFTSEGYYPHTEVYELEEANEENEYLLNS